MSYLYKSKQTDLTIYHLSADSTKKVFSLSISLSFSLYVCPFELILFFFFSFAPKLLHPVSFSSILVIGSRDLLLFLLRPTTFLVACTRLYKTLCRSVRPSVRPSVRLSVRPLHLFSIAYFAVSRLAEPHYCPCPTARD